MNTDFLQKIQQSIYSPEFYRELRSKSFRYSLRYFLTLCLSLAIIGTVIFSVRLVPAVSNFTTQIGPRIASHYPDELVATFSKGVLSTNVPEPYFIKLPPEFPLVQGTSTSPSPRPENLIVIDTKATSSSEKLHEYNTLILATRESVIGDDGTGVQSREYGRFFDITLSKQKVSTSFDTLHRFAPLISTALVGALFIFVFLFFAAKLLYLLIGALIILFIAKFRKTPLTYKTAYCIGLHAITPAILVQSLLAVYGAHIPYLFTAVFIIAVIVNFSALQQPEINQTSETLTKEN